jgi:hypothetical protein
VIVANQAINPELKNEFLWLHKNFFFPRLALYEVFSVFP